MPKPSPGSSFSITLGTVTMQVECLAIPNQEVYRVVFSSTRLPLVLARAEREDGSVFWTSIPEGRQKEATGMGKILEEHFSKM